MKNNKSDIIPQICKIKGGKPVYGTVKLSGDPFASIFNLANALFFDKETVISNVSRCEIFFRFIKVLDTLGVVVKWHDESTLSIDGKQKVGQNLVNLFDGYDYLFAQVLIPVILYKNSECDVHQNLRDEVKFLRGFGVSVSSNYGILNLTLPLNTDYEIVRHLSLKGADPFLIASRLLLSKLFPNITVDYGLDDKRFDFINKVESCEDQRICVVNYNQYEFNLYANIAAFTNGDLVLENFDLSESLGFLLALSELGSNYETLEGNLTIWRQHKKFSNVLDWTSHSFNNVCHLLYSLSSFTQENVKVICNSDLRLEQYITDLNILGSRIELTVQKDFSLISVKPSNSFSAIKTTFEDLDACGSILTSAIVFRGNSKISNFNILSDVIPYLVENLKSINIDITSV